MAQVDAVAMTTTAPPPRAPMSTAWLGVVPFFSFAALFLLLPTAYLVVGAFQDAEGHFTLANLAGLWEPGIRSAYLISLEVSAASALLGAAFGFALAWAVVFADLVGFTRRSERLDVEDVEQFLAPYHALLAGCVERRSPFGRRPRVGGGEAPTARSKR